MEEMQETIRELEVDAEDNAEEQSFQNDYINFVKVQVDKILDKLQQCSWLLEEQRLSHKQKNECRSLLNDIEYEVNQLDG